jgi:hypothetical protein
MPNKLSIRKQFLAESYSFEEAAGFLIKHCVPPNRAAITNAVSSVAAALLALKAHYLQQIEKNYDHGTPNSPEQQKYNYSRAKIKQDHARLTSGLYRKLAHNIWF